MKFNLWGRNYNQRGSNEPVFLPQIVWEKLKTETDIYNNGKIFLGTFFSRVNAALNLLNQEMWACSKKALLWEAGRAQFFPCSARSSGGVVLNHRVSLICQSPDLHLDAFYRFLKCVSGLVTMTPSLGWRGNSKKDDVREAERGEETQNIQVPSWRVCFFISELSAFEEWFCFLLLYHHAPQLTS